VIEYELAAIVGCDLMSQHEVVKRKSTIYRILTSSRWYSATRNCPRLFPSRNSRGLQ